ncbi:hypothetical protein M5D96_014114 [Drosophila gunungcola]|uniref:Uncharacterized protein n=1 Tax=Drosophila gunungcola TaxID=103775 RepID=A0A9P9YAL7_9MUSC|nr:hypothetical protein M5D96_014114 [Drosophila gunungcola]
MTHLTTESSIPNPSPSPIPSPSPNFSPNPCLLLLYKCPKGMVVAGWRMAHNEAPQRSQEEVQERIAGGAFC